MGSKILKEEALIDKFITKVLIMIDYSLNMLFILIVFDLINILAISDVFLSFNL